MPRLLAAGIARRGRWPPDRGGVVGRVAADVRRAVVRRRHRDVDLGGVHLQLLDVPRHQLREGQHDRDPDDLDDHERHRAPVDLPGGDRRGELAGDLVHVLLRRRDAAQIEQREAERRVHERGLHVDPEQDAEPDQVDAELVRHRPEQRHDDERELEEVEEERQDERQQVDEDQEADVPARQAEQHVLDPQVAVDAAEGEREDGRAHQDEDDERGQLGGGVHCLLEYVQAQAPVHQRQHQRAGGPHRAALGRGRDAEEDRAEHEEDQRQRRHEDEQAPRPNRLPAAQRARLGRQRRGAAGGTNDRRLTRR